MLWKNIVLLDNTSLSLLFVEIDGEQEEPEK